jgi:hypothetical protein
MMNLMLCVGGVFAIGLLYVLLPVFMQTYRSLREPRMVRCPETQQPTVIALDRSRGAAGALFGRSTLRVRQCGRWAAFPWHRNCGQECLKEFRREGGASRSTEVTQ